MKPPFYNDIAKVIKKSENLGKIISLDKSIVLIENWNTRKDEIYTLAQGCTRCLRVSIHKCHHSLTSGV